MISTSWKSAWLVWPLHWLQHRIENEAAQASEPELVKYLNLDFKMWGGLVRDIRCTEDVWLVKILVDNIQVRSTENVDPLQRIFCHNEPTNSSSATLQRRREELLSYFA